MKVTVNVEGPWVQILKDTAALMDTDDFEEVFGRSLGLAYCITSCLAEPGARVEIHSPADGPSELDPRPLYGAPGLAPGSLLAYAARASKRQAD